MSNATKQETKQEEVKQAAPKKERKPRAALLKVSPHQFTAGQDVGITEKGKIVPGYTYVRQTGAFHVVSKDGKETRLWLQYVHPISK